MAQQPREENSVVFSLKELRRMEDDRIRQEDHDLRERTDAARRAKEEAERRVVEEAERSRREQEENIARAEEERLARDREEKLRLAEAERRARVEGEFRLQGERMRLEIQTRKAHSPWKAILVAVAAVVILFSAVLFKMRADARAESEAREAARILAEQESSKREETQRKQFEARISGLTKQLEESKSAEERDRIKRNIEEQQRSERARREREDRRTPNQNAKPARPAPPKIQRPKEIDDDPLKGLRL